MNTQRDQQSGATPTASTQSDILLELEEVLSFVDEVLPTSVFHYGDIGDHITPKTTTVVGSQMGRSVSQLGQIETSLSDRTGSVSSKKHVPHVMLESAKNDNPSQVNQMIVTTGISAGEDAQKTVIATKKTARRHRKREKQEIELLRTTICELEAKLAQLRLTNPTRSQRQMLTRKLWASISDGDQETKNDPMALVLDMWKQIAGHQKKEAERSVAENDALRSTLQAQLRLITKLEAAYSQYHKLARAQGVQVTPLQHKLRHCALSLTDAVAFSTMGHEFQTMFTQVDEVLKECKLVNATPDDVSFTAMFKYGTDGGTIIELRDARLVSFPMDVTDRTMWKCMNCNHYALGGTMYEVCQSIDDTINTKISYGLELPTVGPVSASIRVKAKRFTEPSRAAIVWESIADFKGTTPFPSRMKGWYILTTVHNKATSLRSKKRSRPSCIVYLYVKRVSDKTPVELTQDTPKIMAIKNLEIAACHRFLNALVKMVTLKLHSKTKTEPMDTTSEG